MRIHLRRAACDVNGLKPPLLIKLKAVLQNIPSHHLCAVRPRLHMAVLAGKIAQPPHINLQHRHLIRHQQFLILNRILEIRNLRQFFKFFSRVHN